MIAGAGTGKTFCVINRIAHLVETRHVEPSRIWVTTFTRKATAELYHRVHERLGDLANRLRISTIDALIWDLAQEAMHKGCMRSAQLIGEPHQRVLLLEGAMETFRLRDRSLNGFIEDYLEKSRLLDLLQACVRAEHACDSERRLLRLQIGARLKDLRGRRDLAFYFDCFGRPTQQAIHRVSMNYLKKLDRLRAMDCDLLSSSLLHSLKKNSDLTKSLISQADTILVDEFQDTSSVQAEILYLLAGKQRHIWVVGDQCQQIYEWRGAGSQNLLRFRRRLRAREYFLTENRRSKQAVLDAAYSFLKRRVPDLRTTGMLRPLRSIRSSQEQTDEPVYTGTLEQALWLVKQRLNTNLYLRAGDIAILSHELTKQTVKRIQLKANEQGLKVQFHSSRAEMVLEQTIAPNGIAPNWKAGRALDNLYSHPLIRRRISGTLRRNTFDELRLLRPLATACEAFDSSSDKLNFREAWIALRKTQDREVMVTPAVASRPDAIQVMTIHAAKGLEFPVVLLMTLAKKFPNPEDPEDSRLVYVGATRARDLLILIHITDKKPIKRTLSKFGKALVAIRRTKAFTGPTLIQAPAVIGSAPLIAATHLDHYAQCPLKFAAYHEGRFLPKWTRAQSLGSRMHKAIEYYLRAGMPNKRILIDQCFKRGIQDGDSPLRKLPDKLIAKMTTAYQAITNQLLQDSCNVVAVEQRYRYVAGTSGQVEGVTDALLELRTGEVALKEWKTSSNLASTLASGYELQARVGALASMKQTSQAIALIEIVPVLRPQSTISLSCDSTLVAETENQLEHVFKSLRDRRYEPNRGKHCEHCDLKSQCPAWR